MSEESRKSEEFVQLVQARFGRCGVCKALKLLTCEVQIKKSGFVIQDRMYELLGADEKTIDYLCNDCALLRMV